MRPIKFRAWNKKPKAMTTTEFAMTSQGQSEDSEFILMQFTGLLDKNGKEIYEGDIVRGAWSKNLSSMCVFWQAPSFVMKRKKSSETWATFDIHYKNPQLYEIIGNLYENPELLNPPRPARE